MRKNPWMAWLIFFGSVAAGAMPSAHAQPVTDKPDPPRLLVLVVVDQMSGTLLDRHGKDMRHGFRRLLDQGMRFDNATVDHAPTNSLPGHLTAASGAHPRRHGLVDNDWVEMVDGKPAAVSGFDDPACRAVPERPTQPGERGPGRIEAPTIVQWVLAPNPKARFASVGTGGGVSILHAGKAKGPVLWFDPPSASFVTSSCFAERLPLWAARFNAEALPELLNRDWELSASQQIAAAIPDDLPHENGGRDRVFPHRRPVEPRALGEWFNFTPGVDDATLALAEQAVEEEGLGTDSVTDILTIGLSSLDHVGHRFGPTSLEQVDALIRLDRSLGTLLDRLDQRVGKGHWALALTADHGAPPAPEVAPANSGAKRISESDAIAAIGKIAAAGDAADNPNSRAEAAAAEARRLPFAQRVITAAELTDARGSKDPMLRLYANSFRPGRTSLHPLYSANERSAAEFGLIVVPPPYFVVDWAASIHGSPHAYDRDVEMIFYGARVRAGRTGTPARTLDVAPTLAGMADIRPTAEIDGQTLKLIP